MIQVSNVAHGPLIPVPTGDDQPDVAVGNVRQNLSQRRRRESRRRKCGGLQSDQTGVPIRRMIAEELAPSRLVAWWVASMSIVTDAGHVMNSMRTML
jgi:hypothetical protein